MEERSFESLKKAVEAVLFLAKSPLSVKDLKKIVDGDEIQIGACLEELCLDYANRGLQIVNLAGGYQLATHPEVSKYVEKFLKPAVEVHLTTPALETLAIIAYRQPISRYQIEQIRGVDCDSVINTLIEKKLVQEVGRAASLGRPILFGTTEQFLMNFGLASLKELPPAKMEEPQRKISDFSFIYQKTPVLPLASQKEASSQTVEVPVN